MPKKNNNLLSKNPIAVRVYIGDELLLKEYCQRYKVAPSVAVRYIIHQYFILTEQLADRKREAQRYDTLGQAFGNKELELPLAAEIVSGETSEQAEQELSTREEGREQAQQLLQKIPAGERNATKSEEWIVGLAERIGAVLAPKLTEQLTARLVEELSEKLQASNETGKTQIIETLSVEFGQPLNRLVEMLFKYFEEKTASAASNHQDEVLLEDVFEIADEPEMSPQD